MLASGGMEEERKMGGRLSKGYRLPVMREISAMDVRYNVMNAIMPYVIYESCLERKP